MIKKFLSSKILQGFGTKFRRVFDVIVENSTKKTPERRFTTDI
jgi:hypothetical protein